ncbi:MAG: ATP-binding protein [candidate division WOR-3 bacterium]
MGKGTGLGLFITHDIIVRHKGTVHVKSTVGKGTSFFIKLPAAEA